MRLFSSAILTLCTSLCFPGTAFPAVIIAYNDPTASPATRGWLASGNNAPLEGPVVSGGIPAWSIAGTGGTGWYAYNLTAADKSLVAASGWYLEGFLQIAPPTNEAPFLGFEGSAAGNLYFSLQADGDPIAGILSSSPLPLALEGGGPGFHTWRMEQDPGGIARLYADGQLLASGFSGPGSGSSYDRVGFGIGRSAAIGVINIARVEFGSLEAVPEPGSMTLGGLSVVALFRRRSRRP